VVLLTVGLAVGNKPCVLVVSQRVRIFLVWHFLNFFLRNEPLLNFYRLSLGINRIDVTPDVHVGVSHTLENKF
jgi:hypothetical protein